MSIADVYIHGPDLRRQIVSVETSTPKARLFVEAFLASPVFAKFDSSLTSRELRAIIDGTDVPALTRPMSEPFPDVIQDLWQLSHVTTSYLARAFAGGIILATGIVDDNAVAIVVRRSSCHSCPKSLRLVLVSGAAIEALFSAAWQPSQ